MPPARIAELKAALATGTIGKVLRRDDIADLVAEVERLRVIEERAVALRTGWMNVPAGEAVTMGHPAVMALVEAKTAFLAALPGAG